ncbi:MAG: hypothetical protein IJS96_01740, partial [Schwartzia sp.]|nr:hypothetical protein [Schwartzia sp. (in: firmicutes)]
GGIVGHVHGDNYGGKCSITNVYNTGAVTATGGKPGEIAGDPGSGTLTNTYTSADGDLKKAATFTGFDFSSNGVWRIYEGKTTPLLTAFLTRKDYYEEVEYNGTATGDVGLHNAASSHFETGIAQTGAKAFNYIKDYTEVTPKELTVSFGAAAKEYDGTTAATAGTAALNGIVEGDDVSLNTTNLAAAYDNENAGTGKTVTYTGIALTGGKAKNYRLTAATYTGTGTITRKALELAATPQAITEGEATPTSWSGTLTGFVTGEGLGANDVCFFALDNPAASAAGSYSVTGRLSVNGGEPKASGDYGDNYTFANAAANATAFTIRAYTPPPPPTPDPNPEPYYPDPAPYTPPITPAAGGNSPVKPANGTSAASGVNNGPRNGAAGARSGANTANTAANGDANTAAIIAPGTAGTASGNDATVFTILGDSSLARTYRSAIAGIERQLADRNSAAAPLVLQDGVLTTNGTGVRMPESMDAETLAALMTSAEGAGFDADLANGGPLSVPAPEPAATDDTAASETEAG